MAFYWAAFLVFSFSAAIHWVFILKNRWLGKAVSYPINALGFVLLSVFLGIRGQEVGACPIGNPFEIICLMLWTSAFFYLFISLFFSIHFLGFFTSTFLAGTMAIIRGFPALDYVYDSSHVNDHAMVAFHASLAVFSYGVFALLSLLAIMFLLQERALRRKRMSGFFSRLPSLMKLENFQLAVLAFGVFLLTLSLVVGAFSYVHDWGNVPIFKLSATVLVWVLYCLLLIGKISGRIGGGLFSRLLLGTLFFALLALVPVDKARQQGSPPESAEVEVSP